MQIKKQKTSFIMDTKQFINLTKNLITCDTANKKIYKQILYIITYKKFLKQPKIKNLVSQL